MKSLPCLSPETLQAYQAGSADPDQLDDIAEHLSSCPTCLSRLEQAGSTNRDPLLQALRRQQGAPATPVDPLVAAAAAQAIPAVRALAPGATLHEYRVLEKLGAGGMGAVYRALHVRLEKEVALKVIHPRRDHDSQMREWFQREMRAIGKLQHTHIVQATDAGEADGVLYLVMELEQGIDLSRLVRERGPLPVAEACDYARQAALGLQCAHEAGLVHRDVKPSNLLRISGGKIKLLDLGLALLAATDESGTNSERASGPMGTDEYMAPEQWSNPHDVDARADLYSLGCTLFYLLTGQPVFSLPLPVKRRQMREAHLSQPARSVRSLRADVPLPLEKLVNRLLAKDPRDRPSSAAEVAHELARIIRPRVRSSWWAVTVAGLVIAASLMGLLISFNPFRRGMEQFPTKPAEVNQVTASAANAPVEPPPKPAPAPKKLDPPPAGTLPMHSGEAEELQRKWAVYLKRSVTFTNSADMKLALVPPGSFLDFDNQPTTISTPFFLATTEVTVAQFRQFVIAERYTTEAESDGKGGTLIDALVPARSKRDPKQIWSSPGFMTSDHSPVVHVTWNDALAYCLWLSKKEQATYRLPTAEEWVWAARCGDRGPGYRGDESELAQKAWVKANAENHPHEVRTRRANYWGLYDLIGNVGEWCGNDVDAERMSKMQGKPISFAGMLRLTAGGSYTSTAVTYQYHASRTPPQSATSALGFRVVCEVQAPPAAP